MNISKCTFTSTIISKNMSDSQINLNFDNTFHVKHTTFAEVAVIFCFK